MTHGNKVDMNDSLMKNSGVVRRLFRVGRILLTCLHVYSTQCTNCTLHQQISLPEEQFVMITKPFFSLRLAGILSKAVRGLHLSQRAYGLEEFFENGEAFPIITQQTRKIIGRSWSPNELRIKSFSDLHKLWFVLLKELNVLSTQRTEAKRLGQKFFGLHRINKVQPKSNFISQTEHF